MPFSLSFGTLTPSTTVAVCSVVSHSNFILRICICCHLVILSDPSGLSSDTRIIAIQLDLRAFRTLSQGNRDLDYGRAYPGIARGPSVVAGVRVGSSSRSQSHLLLHLRCRCLVYLGPLQHSFCRGLATTSNATTATHTANTIEPSCLEAVALELSLSATIFLSVTFSFSLFSTYDGVQAGCGTDPREHAP